jgi:hypothetical protein
MTRTDIRRRLINSLVGLVGLVVTEVGRHVYRPIIYSRGIFDFHVADTLGNSVGTMTLIFFLLAVFGRDRKADDRIILCGTVGTVLYELGSPLLGKPIDPWDVAATAVAGGLSWPLARRLHRPDRDLVSSPDSK